MTQLNVSTFLDYLQRSRLIDEARFDNSFAKMQAELGPEKSEQLEAVTRWWVSQKFLTDWQVKQLLRKRYKGFFLRQYKILSHIGAGGMSTVYLAEHNVMQRRVAIKVLPKKKLEKSIYLDRFIREAQTIASLDHPNIVRAYDIDQEDDVHYIVMEYFEGRNLQEVVAQDGVMSFETAADYVRQAALALEYAHQAGVVHRDVKPGNVLVNSDGLVKVLDLGLALLDERNFDGQLTSIQEDKILGTADYLAPEQGIDSHTVDGRADIYGLGGVLYFCLTGHPPFPTGTIPQRLLAHQHEEPQSIFVDRPEAPDSLVRLWQKMMAKKKEQRQQSALEVVADMQNWLIDNGFAVESDFPPLETLRATTRTLGAVPIPTQEQRLRDLDDEQWLARQQEEHRKNQHYRQSNIGLAEGNSDIIGYVGNRSLGTHGNDTSGDSQHDTDGSTVSGMMQPVRKSGQPGSGISDNTQFGSASSTGSASRIHLLTDGQSSALMPNPNRNSGESSAKRRGIIDDEDDDLPLGTGNSSEEDANDPVLFAMNEMGLSGQHTKPQQQHSQQVKQSQQKHARDAARSTTQKSQNASQNVTPVAVAIAPVVQGETAKQGPTSQAGRAVSQALAAELHEHDDTYHASRRNARPLEWHRQVPVWFWFLFGGFVISTIFLAGILVAIIFRM